jgi:hypothetical protein
MADINVTDYTPVWDDPTDDNTYVAVPQSDGRIRYFMGNLARVGSISHIIVEEPGRYAKGVQPKVQILDEAGEPIEGNGGASFFVKTGKKGGILDAYPMPDAGGTGFHNNLTSGSTSLEVKFTVENAADCLVPAKAYAIVYLGVWDDNITASEVEAHNSRQRELIAERVRNYKPALRDRVNGVAGKDGDPLASKHRETADGRRYFGNLSS